MGNFTYHAWRL